MDMSLPNYRVRIAFDQYRVGDVIQPTGIWRDRLLQINFIERMEDGKPLPSLLTPPRHGRRGSSHA